MHDELTHLPNRLYALTYVSHLLDRRSASDCFVVFNIDLNDFKKINDTYGHNVGDEYLKYIADNLTRCVRKTDVVARMGGDEFIVVIRGVSSCDQIEIINYKITRQFERNPFLWGDICLHGSFSIGHAVFMGQGISLDDLLAQADHNMYLKKAKFKQQFSQAS